MKQHYLLVLPALFAIVVFSCGGSDPAAPPETARKIEEAIVANRPGTIATSGSGYSMTAELNGQSWSATSMMPPEVSSRIIGYFRNDYIGLPYDVPEPGKSKKLGPDNAIDVFVESVPGGWLTTSGQITITKADAQWVEGTFTCTMKSTENKGDLQVTKGFFRIPAASR